MTENSEHRPQNLEKLRKQIEEAKKNGQTTISVAGIDERFLADLKKYSDMLTEEGKEEKDSSKEELGKTGNALADELDKSVQENEAGKQKWKERFATAGQWFVETAIEKPMNIIGDDIAAGKIEDVPIDLVLAMGEQLLKVLDGINNWIISKKAEKESKKKEAEKGENVETKNLPKASQNLEKTENKQTNNIPKPKKSIPLEMLQKIRGNVH